MFIQVSQPPPHASELPGRNGHKYAIQHHVSCQLWRVIYYSLTVVGGRGGEPGYTRPSGRPVGTPSETTLYTEETRGRYVFTQIRDLKSDAEDQILILSTQILTVAGRYGHR